MIRMMGLVDLRAIGTPVGSRTTTYESLGLPTSDTIGEEDGKIKPSNDHEVSMANNSLDAIIRDANELKTKLGTEEKDIPAWIQNHITNAENFISQAANNYHELNTPDTASPPQDTEPLSEEEYDYDRDDWLMRGGTGKYSPRYSPRHSPRRGPRTIPTPSRPQGPQHATKDALLQHMVKYHDEKGVEREATVRSLLSYDKNHPGRKIAARMYAQHMAKNRGK
jgi:hypothetical protein